MLPLSNASFTLSRALSNVLSALSLGHRQSCPVLFDHRQFYLACHLLYRQRHLVYHSHNHGAFRIGLEMYSDAIIASLYNSIIYIIVCTSSAIMDTAEGPGLISIGMSIRLGVMCQILAIQMLDPITRSEELNIHLTLFQC